MIAEERRAHLLQILNEDGYIQVAEVAEKLNITAATIRRDLSMLEGKGICVRKRGGAVRTSHGVGFEPPYAMKLVCCEEEKRRIGEAANRLVDEGNTIILDAGSTTYALALQLVKRKNIRVVTNDLQIAVTLAANPNIDVICTGGSARPYVFSLQGSQTESFIKNLRVDKTFLGADAIHENGDITNVNIEELSIKQAMIAAAGQMIVLADSTKFEKTGFIKVCNLAQVDLLITDRNLSPEKEKFIRSIDVSIICV